MGRTSDAKEKILTAAQSLLEQRGYSALGVAEICKVAGVPKGSFYYFYESKEALALAVIDEQWAGERRDWQRILGSDDTPLQRLKELFAATQSRQQHGQDSCGVVSGCMFGNLSLEMSNQVDSVRGRLQEIFEAQVDMVEATVAEAQARGDASVADPREAARAVVAQLEGQVLFAKLYNTTMPLSTLWPNCLALLGAAHDPAVAEVA